MTAVNPVDDTAFTRPLARALQGHVDAIAAGITGLPKGRTSSEDDDARREVAVPWVYMSVLVAWAEDHQLIDPWLRVPAAERTARPLPGAGPSARGWLAHAVRALAVHPSTWCLLDPRYTRMRDGQLPEGPVRDLLDWWAADAPSLAYPTPDAGPDSLSGWLPGDLLQHVSDTRRKGNALAQTPWWVADLINDLTLRPAAAEFAGQVETLRAIDPTCGTGHFLSRLTRLLWELYTTGTMPAYLPDPTPISGWVSVPPPVAAQRILAGLDGIELDPLTAAVARLRITVDLAARLAGRPVRLDRIPHSIRPRILVGDSLLMGVIPLDEYRKIRPLHAAIHESERHLFGAVAWPGTETAKVAGPPPVTVTAPSEAEQLAMFEDAA